MKITVNGSLNLSDVKDKDFSLISLDSSKDAQVLLLESGQKSLALGIGEKDKFTKRKLILHLRKIITLSKANKIKKFAINFNDLNFSHLNISDYDLAQLISSTFVMADFQFIKYKTKDIEDLTFVEEVIVVGKENDDIKNGLNTGIIIGEEINEARVLSNTPGGDMTPELLAQSAMNAASNTSIQVKVLGKKEIEDLKMGGLLGVSRGSTEDPKFIIMEYLNNGDSKPIVLVGKGVTFDTGGLSLKPAEYMNDMHMDMSGASAVIHTIVTAAKLGIKKNIVALIPTAENMVSGNSYRPGDVLTTMSGITVEVLNTDAEGRLILADALTYAKKYDPKVVIDVATLTGASQIAIGQRLVGLFSKDEDLVNEFKELGEESGDYVWHLPLEEEFEEDIKGTFADFANIGKTRYGGASTAAIFLYQFAKDYPWVHLDIAPRIGSIEGEHLAKGSIGSPIRLLIKLLEKN